ncbi:MAG: glycosyltransferase family 9 protein [Verrucomicrobiota bacterium]
MNLAIFKTNYLGDNVVFLPTVQELRRRYPQWRLTLITSPADAPLYAHAIPAEDLFCIAPLALKRLWRSPLAFARWYQTLRRRRFAGSLVSYDQPSTAHALARLTGGPIRAGADGLRIRVRGALTHTVGCQPGWSIAQWNWEITRAFVTALGGTDWPATPPPPDLSHLADSLARRPSRVVLHAGSKWEFKRWPLERFTELAGRLARDHEVIWIDAPDTCAALLPPNVARIATPDLRALVSVLASASLYVGNNSGPMHVANALGTPMVVVTGPSDTTWDPAWYRDRAKVLRLPDLACQPCEGIHFLPEGCTNFADPRACLLRWSVDTVETICRAHLAAQRTRLAAAP